MFYAHPQRTEVVNYHERLGWWLHRPNPYPVAIYNNGRNLYFDQRHSPPHKFYDYPWTHLPFIESNRGSGMNLGRFVYLRSLGHQAWGLATVGVAWTGISQIRVIPPMHILYLIIGSDGSTVHLQFQPLPIELVPFR